MKNIYMIGNTHFDPVWLWRWDEAMASIHSTFRSALDRMNEDDDFIYSFATPPVFEWIKKTDPDMFEEIKLRVAQKRWELPEGWWLQPDCYSASGESYARQSLYGQKYLFENFGIYADTVFNIDSFGHNSQTPQILQKSGMKNYVFSRPNHLQFKIDSPYFNWIGKDGSKIKAFRAGQFSDIYHKDLPSMFRHAENTMQNADCDEMMIYGVTNHGGAPTKKAISDIHVNAESKSYKTKFAGVADYFNAQNEPTFTVEGELLTDDFGPYINNVQIKRSNRTAEYSALNAERASIIAKRLLNKEYPQEKLDGIWHDIMFNQFHDILGGASIKEAYIDAENMLGRAIATADEITKYALTAITHNINLFGKNGENPWNIVVWNLHPEEYNGYIEAELQWLHEFPAYEGDIILEDESGNTYQTQKLLEGSVIKGFRSKILFKADIPAMGYKSFKVIKTGAPAMISNYQVPKTVVFGQFEAEFDERSGLIRTLAHKESGKIWNMPIHPTVFEDEGDTWCFNTSGYGKHLEDFTLCDIIITEKGIHRTTVKAIYRFRSSMLTLYYTFYEDRVDICYRVNWNEKHTVLKLMLDFGYDELLAASPFASEIRIDTAQDLPMGEWLHNNDGDNGMLILCDSAFAYGKNGSNIGISLLRSCIYGDLRISELNPNADYPYMEQGITEGKIRLMPKATAENAAKLGAELNDPPIVIVDANHTGRFNPKTSFAKINAESISVSAIKQSYDGNSEIIRLYEYLGKAQTVKMNYFGEAFDIDMKPYEIKTIKIENGRIRESNIIEE